jgi:molybdate transport system ATP-binding protein
MNDRRNGSDLLEADVQHRAGQLSLKARFTLKAERCALVGPSGAGKSTLLRILAGLVPVANGTVRLEGRTLQDRSGKVHVPAGARRIGFLTQGGALFPHLSVEENLRFGLSRLAIEEQQQRIAALLHLLGIEALRNRQPAKLSGGERQVVALARSLAPGPRLLLLDEPFSALDGDRKAVLWAALLPWLREHRVATLLVSHDAGEVWAGAESVLRMEAGIALKQGTPEEILSRDRDRVLRQFSGR